MGVAPTAWVPLGPAPLISDRNMYGLVSGRATAVAIDPSDPSGNTVFVGGAYGGVWKSNNAAASPESLVQWTPITDDQASLATGAVSVKPDGSVVLVGTGEPNNSLDSYYGVGILRSTNGGASWTLISSADGGAHPFAGLGAAKFAWSTANGQTDTVVAAMATTAKGFDEGAITANTNRGLYRSTNGGQSWSYQALPDGAPISATDVVYNASAARFVAAIRYHGLYTSADGTNWTRATNQPAMLTAACSASATCPIYRGQLAVVPGRDEVYFWFVDLDDTGANDQGIWRSINGGAWAKISEVGLTNCGDPAGCGAENGFYNLTLAAVPDGNAVTDLYAGAVNLFKCKLPNDRSSCLTSDVNLPNSWVNLTHANGACSDKAKVHPAQHGMDFAVIGGKALLYFANDGGVNRALDGYSGLSVGSCDTAGTNQFDNLNGTLGSLTQFTSLSIDPNDQGTVLGGAQGNGSPATVSATSSATWTTVNGGDGGYSIINPANTSQWFTAYTDVSIQVCNNGIDCDATSFVPVVSNASVGGDAGSVYTPYILDPQNPDEFLVGTCRVWRGSTTGAAFLPVSPNFDMLSDTTCSGNEINFVRAIAAGGPVQGGFSSVVYAVTEGTGPNCAGGCGGPSGGEVWRTMNAGATEMSEVTGAINPLNYTISSVAIDGSDAAGRTAYVGVMGFVGAGNAHIWKTTNAGRTWVAFGDTTNGLPDAPVNALLVDSAAGTLYAGTDVGVFSSPTTSAAWAEVGPIAQPGASGYLPNVAVTAIRMFDSGGTKKLRASTYGRGIWEFALALAADFSNVISDSPQTIFPTQTATFHGTVTALNGYGSAVNLACTVSPTTTCTVSPTQITPTESGVQYTVTVSGPIADYTLTVDAVGTDSKTIRRKASAFLRVVDFGLTDPVPATVTSQVGGTSDATTFNVTAAGSFSGSVTLVCTGPVITAGASCNFSPSATVQPVAGSPVSASVTVSVPAGIAVNNYAVTIQAMTAGAPATKTKVFTLKVISAPDFTWTGGGSHTVLAGQITPAYTFTATPLSGTFTSDVTFSCSNLPDTTVKCLFNPTQISSGSRATTVTLMITTLGPNSGTGEAGRVRTSRRVQVLPMLLPLAGIVIAGCMGTRMRGRYRIAAIVAAMLLLGMFAACGGISGSGSGGGPPPPPDKITLSVSPSSTNVIAGGTTNFVAAVKNASSDVKWAVNGVEGGTATTGTIVNTGMDKATFTAPDSLSTPANFTITAVLVLDPTKSGSATVNIPAVGVVVAPSTTSLYADVPGNAWPVDATQRQFTATVNNAANQTATWAVAGGSANGTIDANGIYSAPASVPNPADVTITATSQADGTKSGSGTLTILTPTKLGTYPNITVSATEGVVAHSQMVTLTVQ